MAFGQFVNPSAEAKIGSERTETGLRPGNELMFREQGSTYTNQEIFQIMANNAARLYQSQLPDLSYLLSSTGPERQGSAQNTSDIQRQGYVASSPSDRAINAANVVLKVETPKLDTRIAHDEHTNSDLPTTRWGTVTKAEADKQWNTYESLPKADRALLQKNHYHMNIGNSLADYKPDLVGKDARGQHRKQEQIHAFQDPSDHSINFTLHPVIDKSGPIVIRSGSSDGPNQEDGIKHETGHALDEAFHDFSQSKAFMDAYEKDKALIAAKLGPGEKYPDALKYYLNPVVNENGRTPDQIANRKSEIGRSELFAEMYSAIRTLPENRTPGQKLIIESFHNVLMVENSHLQEFNHKETLKAS
jgi:hypothetical protein